MATLLEYYIKLENSGFNATMRQAISQTERLDNLFGKIRNTIALAFSAQQIGQFVQSSSEIYGKLEAYNTRLEAASRTVENFNANQSFLNNTIKNLKIPMMETIDSYSKFVGATRGTNLEGEKTREVFLGIATAGKVMKLENEAQARVYNSLTKMISTGNVQADEFKNMLAEALPGAAEAGARAMNMTLPQFFSEMEKGNIKSAQFVTRFAHLLKEEYGSRLPAALDTFQSKMAEVNNNILFKTAEIGEKSSVIYLKWLEVKLKAISAVAWAVDVYTKYHAIFNSVGAVLIGATAGWLAYTAVLKITAVYQTAAATTAIYLRASTLAAAMGAGTLKAAWIALNATFAITPIGWIIIAIGTLVAAAIYAYNHFETFRKVLDGLWSTAKAVFENMLLWLKNLIAPIKIVVKFITDGPSGAKEAWEEYKNDTIKLAQNTKDIITGKSFMEGYNADRIAEIERQRKFLQVPFRQGVNPAFGENPWSPNNNFFGKKSSLMGSMGENNPIDKQQLSTSVASGRSVRNVTVNITNLVNTVNNNFTTVKETADQTKRIVEDALRRAVLDTEASL